MNETTHRFLQAIVERLPGGRIAELRLFPAIRQGGIESAVAVVALEQPELPIADAADAAPLPGDGSGDGFAEHPATGEGEPVDVEIVAVETVTVVGEDTTDVEIVVTGAEGGRAREGEEGVVDVTTAPATELPDADEPIAEALDVEVTRIMTSPFSVHAEGTFSLGRGEGAGDRETELELTVERSAHAATGEGASRVAEAAAEDDEEADAGEMAARIAAGIAADLDADVADVASRGDAGERTSPRADAEVARGAGDTTADTPRPAGSDDPDGIALGDILALPPREEPRGTTAPDEVELIKRYAILTACYRLTLKGPDRGKWEVDIVHEADAPLATVERVARGVARRAGDESDPEHFSGEALRHAIEQPSWATPA